MPGADFFGQPALPSLRMTAPEAAEIAASRFGLAAAAEPLGSEQDANFLLRSPGGAALGVLKIANPVFGPAETEAQDAAAELVAAEHPDLRVATPLPGTARHLVETAGGPAVARVLRFLPGGTLWSRGYLPPAAVARLGDVIGRVGGSLAGFEHPGLDRVLQWDPRHADRLAGLLLGFAPPGRRSELAAAHEGAWTVLTLLDDDLPRQAVHLDITDDNTVVDAGRLPDGLIDFGDLTTTWAIAELASGLASILHHPGAEPASVLPAVRAFHARRPVTAAEAAALWRLVVLRAVCLVLNGGHQAEVDDGNAYANERLPHEWRILDRALSVPAEVMTGLIRDAVGLRVPRPAAPAGSLAGVTPLRLDLSCESADLDGGAWLRPGLAGELAAARLAAGAPAVATRHAEARLTEARPLAAESPATVATGLDVWFAADTVLTAPWPGAAAGSGEAVLEGAGFRLEIGGGTALSSGDVAAGEPLARVPAGERARITLRKAGPGVPAFVRPEYAAGWLALTADPGPLLGLPEPPEDPAPDLLERRAAHFADVQEFYYDAPPRIERGWRHHLITTDGCVLLDMINNVAAVGHAHPRLAEAAARQLARLNTNSRFNYAAVVDFAERLAALLPGPLDTVFLVNSGSEAADLALRLALVGTGRPDVVALREAYHGWTYLSDAVSTSVADNPRALETRPAWVHPVDAPDTYRGEHAADPDRYGAEAARAIDELAAAGRPPAAFIAETYHGNAGGMPLPDGYLREVYAAVRRHGGLAIADEVQVGYGRLGAWFWGFEEQDVVPDIVITAKGAGNGHPLGAVVTSRAVAERYREAGYFFSSTGGSPLSSVVGTTVLDILRDEALQENARTVGAHLKTRLLELAERHPLIGAVHGYGLYMGVELVRDRETREPAVAETTAICERMLELGVVVQPTGDRMCVLKVKPPLCLDRPAADFFADALDRVLTEGW